MTDNRAGGTSWHDGGRRPADEYDSGWPLHLLLAGDIHDAPQLRELLSSIPDHAYGQVYVEAATTGGQESSNSDVWDLPRGMSLTVLRRSPGTHRPRRGELLAAAVSAWATEWLSADPCACTCACAGSGPFALWIGCAASPAVEDLCRSLNDRLDVAPVHVHRPEH
ncbi:hypothetical protein AB1046_05380 [Promicromonospora sp. Populi]|uniref:hypothetical protein n=1 Tax=Promicromonospora sp. Populi TaxID=3239420 RepID=UPI0034E21932